ncbi:MAG: hypothetical protein O3A01_06035 [bacterium]|nr:hypothetical protein [bacterium]
MKNKRIAFSHLRERVSTPPPAPYQLPELKKTPKKLQTGPLAEPYAAMRAEGAPRDVRYWLDKISQLTKHMRTLDPRLIPDMYHDSGMAVLFEFASHGGFSDPSLKEVVLARYMNLLRLVYSGLLHQRKDVVVMRKGVDHAHPIHSRHEAYLDSVAPDAEHMAHLNAMAKVYYDSLSAYKPEEHALTPSQYRCFRTIFQAKRPVIISILHPDEVQIMQRVRISIPGDLTFLSMEDVRVVFESIEAHFAIHFSAYDIKFTPFSYSDYMRQIIGGMTQELAAFIPTVNLAEGEAHVWQPMMYEHKTKVVDTILRKLLHSAMQFMPKSKQLLLDTDLNDVLTMPVYDAATADFTGPVETLRNTITTFYKMTLANAISRNQHPDALLTDLSVVVNRIIRFAQPEVAPGILMQLRADLNKIMKDYQKFFGNLVTIPPKRSGIAKSSLARSLGIETEYEQAVVYVQNVDNPPFNIAPYREVVTSADGESGLLDRFLNHLQENRFLEMSDFVHKLWGCGEKSLGANYHPSQVLATAAYGEPTGQWALPGSEITLSDGTHKAVWDPCSRRCQLMMLSLNLLQEAREIVGEEAIKPAYGGHFIAPDRSPVKPMPKKRELLDEGPGPSYKYLRSYEFDIGGAKRKGRQSLDSSPLNDSGACDMSFILPEDLLLTPSKGVAMHLRTLSISSEEGDV